MNRTLCLKAFRDSWLLLLVICAAVMLFEVLISHAMAAMAPQFISLWKSFGFLRSLFKFTFHIDLTEGIQPVTLLAIGMAHPFLFAVTWAHLIAFCTRVPVGDVERGTADLMFSLPCSRSTIYLSNSLVCALQIVPLAGSAWFGLWLGSRTVDLGAPFPAGTFALAAINYGLLLFAICGVTYLLSCFLSRRALAIGLVVGLLLISFMINVLAAFLPAIRNVQFLGLLSYHRPAEVIRFGFIPSTDVIVLIMVGLISWAIGWWRLTRRDIPAA